MTLHAGFTHPAGDGRVHCDQLADFQAIHPRPQLGDPSREFMTHDDGCGDHLRADAPFQIIMYVGATDADSGQAQQHLTRARFRSWQFLQTHVSDTV